MKRSASAIATRPTGTLTQKIERQSTTVTARPPTTGPSAIESPDTAPHTPTACARSRGSVNVLTMIDIATGLSIDPPTACSARNATSHSTVGARLHSSEATVNTPRPAASTRLRPSRSAVEPASINRLASTTVYASTVHCSPETPACRSPPSDGSATLTAVMSRPTMNRLMQQISRTLTCRDIIVMKASIPASVKASIEEERPPVLHRPPGVVERGVVETGHVLAPVEDPPAHAVRRELAERLEDRRRPRAGLESRLAPGLDRRAHRAATVEVVVEAPVGHEVDVAAGRDVAVDAVLAPAGPVLQRAGRRIGDVGRALEVERLERQPVAAIEVEHRVLAEVALVVRQRAAGRHTLERVAEALHRAADATGEVHEQDAQAAADPRRVVLARVARVVLDAHGVERLVVGALDLDGLPRRAVVGVVGQQPHLIDQAALRELLQAQPVVQAQLVQRGVVEADAVGGAGEAGGVAIAPAARLGQVGDADELVLEEGRRAGVAIPLPARRLA